MWECLVCTRFLEGLVLRGPTVLGKQHLASLLESIVHQKGWVLILLAPTWVGSPARLLLDLVSLVF